MMNRQILTVLLLVNLGLLAFTAGAIVAAGSLLMAEVLLVAFIVTSAVLFYAVSIQNSLHIELTNFMVGFVANTVYALGGILSGSVAAVGILGSVAAVVMGVNVVAIQNSRVRIPTPPKGLDEPIQIVEEAGEPVRIETFPTTIVSEKEGSLTPVSGMLHEVESFKKTHAPQANVVNVKIDNASNGQNNDAELLKQDLELKNKLEKVDTKIDMSDMKVERRIENVKQSIEESFDDVKKEIDAIKEKKRMFIASKNGKKMHTPGCMVAERIPTEKRVVLEDYEEAVKKGYSSCGVCHPTGAMVAQK